MLNGKLKRILIGIRTMITKQTIEVNGKKWEIRQNLMNSSKSIPALREDIYKWLLRIGILKDFIALEHGPYPRDCWAEVKWKVNNEEFYYRCTSQTDNRNCLAAIEQLVHQEVIFIERGIKTFGQVMAQFRLSYSGGQQFIDPWQLLGIDRKIKDVEYINFRYKQKAKELHPDASNDDGEKMKQLNEAHEMILKEVGK